MPIPQFFKLFFSTRIIFRSMIIHVENLTLSFLLFCEILTMIIHSENAFSSSIIHVENASPEKILRI